jgi:hypothetical protein
MVQIIVAIATALISVTAAFSQTADYSGIWNLDVGKSELNERSRIEAMKMTVTQADGLLTVATETTRAAPAGGGMGRGGRAAALGDALFTYRLDGKETKAELASPMGIVPVKLKAKQDAGKLELTTTRTFDGPRGEVSMTMTEEWSRSSDGKTLTVKRESQSPRGKNKSTLVFTKQ